MLLPRLSARFLFKVAAAFGLSTALWFAVRFHYSAGVVFSGARVLSFFAGMPADEIVKIEAGHFLLDTGISRDGRPHVKVLDVYPVSWNLVYLLTLLAVTPLPRLVRNWKWALAAAAALWLSQVAYFAANVYWQVAATYAQEAPELQFQSPAATRLLAYLVQAYSLTLSHLLPFLLYLPVLLRTGERACTRWRRRAERAGAEANVRRNDPCPCGSGRKYKRCCGAAAG
jgi:hypothetical protein